MLKLKLKNGGGCGVIMLIVAVKRVGADKCSYGTAVNPI
jgi:hypothetical protein